MATGSRKKSIALVAQVVAKIRVENLVMRNQLVVSQAQTINLVRVRKKRGAKNMMTVKEIKVPLVKKAKVGKIVVR